MFEDALKNLISLVEIYNERLDEALEKTTRLVESAKELKAVTDVKPTRTRKTKAKAEDEPLPEAPAEAIHAPTPAEAIRVPTPTAPAPTPAEAIRVPTPAEAIRVPTPAVEKINLETLRATTFQLTMSKGFAAVMDLMTRYGVNDVHQLPEGHYSAFLNDLRALPELSATAPIPPPY